jgi:hypothetical protein
MTTSFTSISHQIAECPQEEKLRFFLITALIVTGCAAFCAMAPIALSIATVFLFAGPHNWIELRYFLSRLPARFGSLKGYFLTGMGGAAAIAVAFPVIAYLGKSGLIDVPTWITAYKLSNISLVSWIVSLILIRHGETLNVPKQIALVAVATTAFTLVWMSPGHFAIALVYTHPLVALVMLDLELRRNKPHLVAPYRLALTLVPLMLAFLWWQLAAAPSIAQTDPLIAQICRHAGADWLTGVSTHFLVAAHTFLETLHYAAWLLAIPLLSAGWNKWRPRSLPITVVSSTAKKLVRSVLLFSSFAAAIIWLCFAVDFNVAREWYFLLAMIHVLAEIPFLIRFL